MFQQAYIARHQSRRDETKRLPERIIPRHDHEDHAHGLEAYETPARRRLEGFIGKKAFRIFGIIAASPRAFDGFVHRRSKSLAHFLPSAMDQAISFAFE